MDKIDRHPGSYEWMLEHYLDDPKTDAAEDFANTIGNLMQDAVYQQVAPLFRALDLQPDDPDEAPVDLVIYSDDAPENARIEIVSVMDEIGTFALQLDFAQVDDETRDILLLGQFQNDGLDSDVVEAIGENVLETFRDSPDYTVSAEGGMIEVSIPFNHSTIQLFQMVERITAAFATAFQKALADE